MATQQAKPRVITLPGHRRRSLASTLLTLHPFHTPSSSHLLNSSTDSPPIRITCISDTHNHQPTLPQSGGDILIHAGDLTENGSFDELQTQLTWLSAQPYLYKIVVAGNHDVLLDEEFLEKYPERRYGESRTLYDLDWGVGGGGVRYLCDGSITLDLTPTAIPDPKHGEPGEYTISPPNNHPPSQSRTLTIYGNPQTPQYGISAFQHPRTQDIWSNKIPLNTDIVVTHGPPKFHLDSSNLQGTGCQFLGREIAGVRPRLVVFGHIHASYGREVVVLDGVRRRYEAIMANWEGWGALGGMVVGILWARFVALFQGRERIVGKERVTTFVNASVVGGSGNELRNEPVVIEL